MYRSVLCRETLNMEPHSDRPPERERNTPPLHLGVYTHTQTHTHTHTQTHTHTHQHPPSLSARTHSEPIDWSSSHGGTRQIRSACRCGDSSRQWFCWAGRHWPGLRATKMTWRTSSPATFTLTTTRSQMERC